MSGLREIRCFVRVAELGSFSAAARELGVAQPTVSKAVAALEARLGAPLLRRTTRSLSPTDEGATYLATCSRLLAELDEVEATLASGGLEPRGRLRISCPREFGQRWLTPVVLEFLTEHAGVEADLSFEDRRVDLAAEGIDLAIRLGRLEDSSLIARRLGSFPRLTAASPAYLASRGTPATPEALAEHDCILHTALQTPSRWTYLDTEGREHRVDVSGRVSTQGQVAALDAALAGFGVILAAGWLLRDAIAAGRLGLILADYRVPRMDVHALYVPGALVPLKVRRFVDLLRERWVALGVVG